MFTVYLTLTSLLLVTAIRLKSEQPTKDWWERAGFYQVYPRSFKDSDGDGIGDLNGITEKLSYLKGIGMRGFWLSPMYKSPMADFGYDISDFRDIQDEYGTMDDFRNQIAEAKRLGLKVILDYVPNHSSDKHEWFIKSVNREPGYEDYYVWRDGKPNPDGSGKPLAPNNWILCNMDDNLNRPSLEPVTCTCAIAIIIVTVLIFANLFLNIWLLFKVMEMSDRSR